MDFAIPSEYRELQRNLVDFVDRELRPLEESELDPEKDDVPVELRDRVRRRAAELGFYAADFPEDLGGSGLPQLGMVLLREAGAADRLQAGRVHDLRSGGADGGAPIGDGRAEEAVPGASDNRGEVDVLRPDRARCRFRCAEHPHHARPRTATIGSSTAVSTSSRTASTQISPSSSRRTTGPRRRRVGSPRSSSRREPPDSRLAAPS